MGLRMNLRLCIDDADVIEQHVVFIESFGTHLNAVYVQHEAAGLVALNYCSLECKSYSAEC